MTKLTGSDSKSTLYCSFCGKSQHEVRKLIANNGLRINDAPVTDPKLIVGLGALTKDGVLKLSSGKKKHVLVKPA